MKLTKIYYTLFLAISLMANLGVLAQVHDQSWREIIYQEEGGWFASEEATGIAENVLLYQRDIGGWPKNIQMHLPLNSKEKKELQELKTQGEGCTTDNGATVQEMRFLSKMYRQVPDERYKEAFLKGVDYLLAAQYDIGGWPQFYPLKKGYYSHITYNDDSMANIMKLLLELKNKSGYYSIEPDETTLVKVNIAFEKGIDCILKTQYVQNGVLTGWCAQHDEKTFSPAKARAYELPSLSGKESANIVLLLMALEQPSPEVVQAVDAAVVWFKRVKVEGLREERFYDDSGELTEKIMVQVATAEAIWARFMELDDNRPFFCDRDGIKKYTMAEIGAERRNGYAWYTNEPKEVLKRYPKWKEKYGKEAQIIHKKPMNERYMVVAKDGSGEYASIQEAINNTKSFPYERITIFVKNGVYYEKVKVHEWNTNLSLVGESKEHTIITYDDYFDKINLGRNSTFFTPTMLVEANDFEARNLTIQNTSGDVGQAVALSVFSDRVMIHNCNILGNQDTLYASGIGKQYYKDCYIDGTTDFIFGGATALFEDCIIHSKKDSYITAASTPQGASFGYVFLNCKLTAEKGVTEVYLGRPWRIYAQTVFLNCEMEGHILPEGWHNWSKPEAEKNAFYAEYNCKGEGIHPEKRVMWSHQLNNKEAKKYTKKNILGEHPKSNEPEWYELF